MRLLDLFCGAGGAAVGYHCAGFDVIGVDIKPMPHYPFEFHQTDALEYVAGHAHEYDVIHASPPCQAYSVTQRIHGRTYPKLIGATRDLLKATGRPWVIENVIGSHLDGITLCGVMFGLKTYRHRQFESNVLLMQPPHTKHHEFSVQVGRRASEGQFMTIAGHIASIEYARHVMDIDWMTRDELVEAVPPAYTEFIGRQLLTYLSGIDPLAEVTNG